MTGKERIGKAVRREKADRAPVFCQLSIGHYLLRSGKVPHRIWFSPGDFTDAFVDLAGRYAFDGVLVNLPGRPRNWETMVASMEDGQGETWISWRDWGVSHGPHGDNVHCRGPALRPSLDEIDPSSLYYIELHCTTEVSYPFSFDFQAPGFRFDSSYFPEYFLDTVRLAVRKCGETLHVSTEVFSPFTQFMELLGYSEGLMALMDDPWKCERILASLTAGASELAVQQARAGADAIHVSSAFAGAGFLSIEHYRRFVLPFEKAVVDRIHRETSAAAYVHTCGSIGDRLAAMVEAGYDGIDTMDQPPLGDTDIGSVKREFGDRVFLKGDIDPVNLLLRGDAVSLRAKAAELIDLAGHGGGYILSTACSVSPRTEPEMISILAETSLQHQY